MTTSNRENGYVVEELRVERERSKLNIEKITYLVDGGKLFTEKRRRINDMVIKKLLFKQGESYFLSDEDVFSKAVESSVNLMQMLKSKNVADQADYQFFAGTTLPVDIHIGMFMPTIESQGTEEQKAKWLPLATNYYIIGTYAQTEMGHGTYIRGLETTATYDPSTEEFVLNSPTLSSLKWWPSGLGHTATHAIVMARLITKGNDHGVHSFIVQLRSLENHTPLLGIEVGDIGPKFGFSTINNGFLRMSNVRIPREQMLMKYSQVSPDGTYLKPPLDRIAYGTMVSVRSSMVSFLANALCKCVTIATRYSIVRRQTQNRPGEPETQVLDYQTQQYKILPLIATAYAMMFAGQYIGKKNDQTISKVAEGNLDSLPEHHATSAGLKAFSTEVCCRGIELCRLSCGGHGYSRASGIPDVYRDATASQTLEGENTVMLLQTARYLLKVFSQKLSMYQLPEDVSYLASDFYKHKRCLAMASQQFSDPHILLEAYRQRARRVIEIASSRYHEGTGMGMDHVAAWNYSLVDWTVAAKAHCHHVILNAFNSTVESAVVDHNEENIKILQALFSLYGVFGIVQNSGEFGIEDYMSTEQISKARQQLYHLLEIVRQEAVPLVDAFDIPDEILNSCLGSYDGDVYNRLYQWAKRAPRNKAEVHPTYYNNLRRVLKSNL